jgi:ATP-dependent helicase/nuclease subunit A
MTDYAYALDGAPCTREAFYATACDPQRNVVVQACAGAGKTWMLVSRILRALLNDQMALQGASNADASADSGAASTLAPQQILAITFTKKAAGEMRQRLQEWLEEFAHAGDAQLAQELIARGVAPHIAQQNSSALRQQLAQLYPALLRSGRSVQIRTFHSWFGALLRSAPLAVLEQLGLPAQYDLLEDDSEAVALVWRRFYTALEADDELRGIYNQAVAAHGMFNVNKALGSALAKRVEFALADKAGIIESSIRPFGQVFAEFSGLAEPIEVFVVGSEARERLADAAKTLGQYDGKIPQKAAIDIERALTDNDMAGALSALVVKEGTARKFSDKVPGIEAVRSLQDLCIRINAAQLQHTAWLHHTRMAQLSRCLLVCFADLKRERAWVDMGDVEQAALHLLSDPVLSGWVLERLDAQTRHLLIDEFQDTNPLQWQALQAWLSGYAGAGGGSGAGATPSVFIVGDPKQSIYRFRRAEPQVFVAATEFVCEALGGAVLSCDHTRRNARGVLAAVNGVMQAAADEGYDGFRPHTTESEKQGLVLRLPLLAAPESADEDIGGQWRDTLNTPRQEAEEHIRTLECEQAARWVAQQITAGAAPSSIMVLSRKRDRLQRMAVALQQLGIASQISEKSRLSSHYAVQDIMALADVLTSPSHNLSLARALKSPLLGCSDTQLIAIAQTARAQRCSWLELLLPKLRSEVLIEPESEPQSEPESDWLRAAGLSATDAAHVGQAAQQLAHYHALFAALPPHDALAAVYQHGDVLARFMAAAPAAQRSAVAAQLQALLAAALEVDGGRFLTPYAWVRALKAGHVRTPPAAAQSTGAVQLHTIHGAKGLEAHTVLLLDAHAAAEKARSMDVLIDWPAQQAAPTTFAFLASESKPPDCVAHALQREQEARAREETNALYVAMTRAQHTLALSAHQVAKPDPRSPWHRFEALDAVQPGLVHSLEEDDIPTAHTTVAGHSSAYSENSFTLKIVKFSDVDIEKLAIKNIVNVVSNAALDVAAKDAQSIAADSLAARIGQCMHRLLELYYVGLDLAPLARSVGAQFQLDAAQSQQALGMAERITTGPASWVWDSAQIDWQANEVELLAASGDAIQPMAVLRLDRLIKHTPSQTWWVLDYKSAHTPERQPALRQQLAQYQQAVQSSHPGAAVRAAFITGEGLLVEL